jgi:hypothetical protein
MNAFENIISVQEERQNVEQALECHGYSEHMMRIKTPALLSLIPIPQRFPQPNFVHRHQPLPVTGISHRISSIIPKIQVPSNQAPAPLKAKCSRVAQQSQSRRNNIRKLTPQQDAHRKAQERRRSQLRRDNANSKTKAADSD